MVSWKVLDKVCKIPHDEMVLVDALQTLSYFDVDQTIYRLIKTAYVPKT